MTIQTTSNKTTAVGNSITVAFPTVFPFTANNEIFVTRITTASGARTPLVEGIDYTLTGAGAPGGGTVSTIGVFSPLTAAEQIEILRVLPLVQLINLVANDQFGAETVERGFDQGIMIDQQLDARLQVVEAASSGVALDGANVGGSGVGVFAGKVANALTFWKLRAGIGMTLTLDSDGIRFDSAGGGASVANVGAGTGLVFRDQVGSTFNFKTLKAGANITLTNGANDITIDAAGGGGGLPSPGAFPTSKFLRGDLTWTNVLAGQSFQLASPGNPLWIDINRDSAPVNERAWRMVVFDGTSQQLFLGPIDDARSNYGGGISIYRNPGGHTSRNVSIFPPLQVGSGFAFGASEPATALWVKGLTKHDGNITVVGGGVGRAFQADWALATPLNQRMVFQSSVANSETDVPFIPNGTSKTASFILINNSDVTAPASFMAVRVDAVQTQLRNSSINGGPGLPFNIFSQGQYALIHESTSGTLIAGDGVTPADLPTNANTRFIYIPCMNGTPTGVPTGKTGFVPIVYDRSANQLCVYNGGVWKKTAVLT